MITPDKPIAWHHLGMETTGTSLFESVQQRIAEGHERIDAVDVSDEVKHAAHRRLKRLDRASRHDLSLASRAVESFHADLDAGQVPIYE